MVMVETTIDLSGQPTQNRVVVSSTAFDEAALTALRQWRFRPARIAGSPTPTLSRTSWSGSGNPWSEAPPAARHLQRAEAAFYSWMMPCSLILLRSVL